MNENSSSTAEKRPWSRRELVTSIRAKSDAKETWSEQLADRATAFFGSTMFLVLNLLVFGVWLVLNMGIVPQFRPFDPFPFGALTTAVSLEAIILAVFVLISQNRASKVADLREETNLQLNMIEEEEITKVLKMLTLLLEKSGIDISEDPELQAMVERTDTEGIEAALEKQLEK